VNSSDNKGVEGVKGVRKIYKQNNPNTENRDETIDETVAIPQFFPGSFNAVHPVRHHTDATLVPVAVSQPASTNCRSMLNAYNLEFDCTSSL
jgi:hypothetical protein